MDRLTEQHGEHKGDNSHESLVKIDGFFRFVLALGLSEEMLGEHCQSLKTVRKKKSYVEERGLFSLGKFRDCSAQEG